MTAARQTRHRDVLASLLLNLRQMRGLSEVPEDSDHRRALSYPRS
jgi:hypothetical protein